MIVLITPENQHFHKKMVDEMHRLRHEIFCHRLGWDLKNINQREIDQFDHNQAYYLVAQDPETSKVIGCLRLMPTTSPHMTRDIFRHLIFPSNEKPTNEITWEVSRFGLCSTPRDKMDLGVIRKITYKMLIAKLEFFSALGIPEILAVIDFRIERIYRMCGWPSQRLGPPDPHHGNAIVVSFPITPGILTTLREKSGIMDPVL